MALNQNNNMSFVYIWEKNNLIKRTSLGVFVPTVKEHL